MPLDRFVAIARERAQSVSVPNAQPPPFRLENAALLQRLDDAADIAPAYAEHCRKLLLLERHFMFAGPHDRRLEPSRCALLDRVCSVASNALEDLRDHAIGVASEQV